MQRYLVYIVLVMVLCCGITSAYAQKDTTGSPVLTPALDVPAIELLHERVAFGASDSSQVALPKVVRRVDSAILARMRFVTDSIQKIVLYAPQNPSLKPLMDSLDKYLLIKERLNLFTFFKNKKKLKAQNTYYKVGKSLQKGVLWLPLSVLGLLFFFVLIRQYHSKQLSVIIQAFYSNRWLNSLGKDNNLINSWLFLLMYLFFGFCVGSFLCLTSRYFRLSYPIEGPYLWLLLSGVIMGILVFKILVLRMIGFVFDVVKIVSEYVSILYVAYFNTSFVLLPLILCFCMGPLSQGKYYVYIGFTVIILIQLMQILRAGINILSHFRLGKFYLLLYICTLEICPILIIVKALAY